jgi:Tfp pilus assembly protein PilO
VNPQNLRQEESGRGDIQMAIGKKQTWHWALIAMGGGLIVLDILFYFAVLAPTMRSNDSRAAEHAEVVKTLATKRADVSKLDSIHSHLQNASGSEAARFEKYLWSSHDGFSSLMELFSDTARQYVVTKGRTDFKSSVNPDSKLLEVKIELPLEGTYSDLIRFINALERSNHLLIIDSVVLQTGQETGSLLRLNLSMTTYLKSI